MKKIFFIALICSFAFMSKPVQAQNNLVKANLLAPLVATGSFYYERVLNDSRSVQLGLFFTKYEELSGYGVTPEYRFYLSETPAPNGFYVAPFLSFMRFTIEGEDDLFDGERYKGTTTNFGGGLVAGRQWIFKDRVSFDIFLGPEYTGGTAAVEIGNEDQIKDSGLNGFIGRAGISLGLKF
ncbi:DUF3575 domain-containing protein [Rufibacter tibetensis]|uniref:DUF3575 domain-containing protein n=1 Tax=Rufibacter tibetensis TaxID=512763 RepID=A0A0P0CUL2_9BACT|nr:DUF3575 domain-containing protein [Rufibacter tibetensis]ALI98978.1 hypothetical protein DC20_08325 [Rufibacter tibetensis]